MKLKLFAALSLFAFAASTQAANVSIADITILPGTATVEVPILISPSVAGETVGAGNISFSAGEAADAIPFIPTGNEFDNTIWDNGGSFLAFSAATFDHDSNGATPEIPSVHNDFAVVSMSGPFQTSADGLLITYTLDTSGLAPGFYTLNPDYDPTPNQVAGTSLLDANGGLVDIVFSTGTLAVIPEPSTVVLTAIFGILGLGVYVKRRRG